MNRDEILRASKEENKNRDIADIEFSKDGIRIAWIVTVCLAVIAGLVDHHVYGRGFPEMLFVVSAGLTIVFFSKYTKMKKRHELFVTIAYGIATVCWLVAWIIQLTSH